MKVLDYKLVDLKTGANELVVPMTAALAPNFDLAVAVMNDPRPTGSSTENDTKEPGAEKRSAAPPYDTVPKLAGLRCASPRASQTTRANDRNNVLAQLGRNLSAAKSLPTPPLPTDLLADPEQEAKPPVIRFHEANSPFYVERELSVKLAARRPGEKDASKDPLRSGEEVEVLIATTDPQGQPVPAEVSVAMIERSLLRRFGGAMPTIEDYFRGLDRQSAMKTVSSIRFAYRPATRPINERLLAEEDRLAISREEEQSRREGVPFGDLMPPSSPEAGEESPNVENPFGGEEKASQPATEPFVTSVIPVIDEGGRGLGRPGSKHRWRAVSGMGKVADFDTNLGLVVSNPQEVHEEITDLGDETSVSLEPPSNRPENARDENAKSQFVVPDAGCAFGFDRPKPPASGRVG